MIRRVESFLVRDGRAVRPDLHARRFGPGYPDVADIPAEGEWFPRVTAAGIELRPAPPLRTATRLWIPDTPDPRALPQVKGPDLPALGELRRQAQEQGADDAVLHRDSFVVEAANSAIVFFDDGMPVVAPDEWRLDSTTVRATVEAGLILQPRRAQITIEQALALPALCASALHGWTPVICWGDVPAVTASGVPDAAELNRALWELAAPLH